MSPFPKLVKKTREWGHDQSYESRPKNIAKPKFEFHLDYDFEKYHVQSLSEVFGKPTWEVKDSISNLVRTFDQSVTSMYDRGKRDQRVSRYLGRMSSDYHFYGQQLGWHCLPVVAGQFLAKYAVTNDSYRGEPWLDWLGGWLLTTN